MNRWQERHVGLAACISSRWRVVSGRPPRADSVSSKAGMLGGGGGGGVPMSTSITHFPRNTGDVRADMDVSRSTLPCPSTPRRLSSG